MSTSSTLNVHELLGAATRALSDAGVSDGRREAEMLIAHALNCTRADLYRSSALALTDPQKAAVAEFIGRRSRREPLQQLLETQEFWGLEFRVTPDVFIPRPETELLIESVLETFPDRNSKRLFVDLCTGTGCLAITLARLYPLARVLATERSPAALAVARFNALRHDVGGRIAWLEGDLLEPLPIQDLNDRVDARVDAIVANPPYIPSAELDHLQPEVRDYEPHLALDGGLDGLDYYRRILPGALGLLRPGGFLFLEVGMGQAESVAVMGRECGWRLKEIRRDLRQIQRVVILTKPGLEPPACRQAWHG